MTGGPRYRAGVRGHPIAHSLSPAMHAAGYAAAGRADIAYDSHDVEATGLAGHLGALDANRIGLSLTMPLKERALELTRENHGTVHPIAAATGSVNTLVFTESGPAAYNTDVAGITGALTAAGGTKAGDVGACAVIGSGATARSAAAALAELSAERIDILARHPHRAEPAARAAEALGIRARILPLDDFRPARYRTIVNTTPIGASADLSAAVDHRLDGLLLDVVYDPWPTPLAAAWERAGGRIIDGAAMLARQAVGQIEKFLAEAARRDGIPGGSSGSCPADSSAITDAVLAVIAER